MVMEIHPGSLLPTGCPINGSNKLAVQRQTDRPMYKVIRSPSCEVPKKCFFNILTSKKLVVQIKQLAKKLVIIHSFRSKKLPKILEI